ncbi:MAG TPA: YggS family pyridoxal phosphate-dependent enzyme [Planctomycetes bacterium]|nr:YggS family pyridoxal phosphate-dependent enzyme [Planctomycetota bacterium]
MGLGTEMNAQDIRNNLERVLTRIAHACEECGRDPEEIELVAVSKYLTTQGTRALVQALASLALPIRLGENRVQALLAKAGELQEMEPRVHWDLIGSLQRNKARGAVRVIERIHSVDRLPLIPLLDRLCAEEERRLPCLLQVQLTDEGTKHGFEEEQLPEALESLAGMERLQLQGFMTMAPRGTDHESARPYFARLRELRDRLAPDLPTLSMGMSGDYLGAVREGATCLRLGSVLFQEGGSHG